jgi:predicted nuclease of restriction endonuclease-like (RecB) superfamily
MTRRKKSAKPVAASRAVTKRPTSNARVSNSAGTVDALMGRVVSILDQARAQVVRSVNSSMVIAYWLIGREIVQAAQGGEERADYGRQVLAVVSATLTKKYGRGYSVTNLTYFRLFYQAYADRTSEIRHTACDESASLRHMTGMVELQGFSSSLSWSHYRTLSAIEHAAERSFYEIEAERSTWSQRELERQIHSHLFARLLKSRDKSGLLALARTGQTVERPMDVIKHPYVLDFLDLPESPRLHETDLETALIAQLQPFLLELGKGFAFVARQQRIATETQHFFIDLVFYNYLLKCFVVIDLKMGKLTHQDVGQMDMYVRMYDDLKRAEGDNPTVGLILCAERDAVVARYSVLHGSQQLFAAKYMLYLPSEAELRAELERERDALAMHHRDQVDDT